MAWNNPIYAACEALLIQLHQLIADQKGDTDEADLLRDSLERYAQLLTKEERQHLSALSGDLYQLQDCEVYEQNVTMDRSSNGPLQLKLEQTRSRQEWEQMLELLRLGPEFLSPPQIAFLRAYAYGRLGRTQVALAFMRYAAEKAPQNPFYKASILRLLCDLDRGDEALAQAYLCIDDMQSEPFTLVLCACILYSSTEGLSSATAHPIHVDVIRVLDRALRRPPAPVDKELASLGFTVLAYTYEAIGNISNAHKAYDDAINWNHENKDALAGKLQLNSRQSGENAMPTQWRAAPSSDKIVLPTLNRSLRAHSVFTDMPLAA